jgi:uncharacterized protein (TIGR00255 family)
MTSFGRGEAPLGAGAVVAEVRTVNARHLDLRLKLPREHTDLEPPVRTIVARTFARGKAELVVRLPEEAAPPPSVNVDVEVAGRYMDAASSLRERFGLDEGLSLEALLTLPGVVRLREPEAPTEEVSRAVLGAVERACDAAAEMRQREGEAIERELSARLKGVEVLVTSVESRADEIGRGLRARLQRRLDALAPEVDLDPSRLEQEVVLYVDRMDVTEETVRLRSHLSQFAASIGSGEPVGRKLEFLLQELVREVNTVGSKISDSEISAFVVDLKSELEKLREQVLNVE